MRSPSRPLSLQFKGGMNFFPSRQNQYQNLFHR